MANNTFAFSNFNGGGGGPGPGAMWGQMQMPPWMYMPPPPWMMQGPPVPPIPAQTPVATTPSPTRKRKFPAINDWLDSIDDDEDRGVDNLNYKQYADTLSNIGIIRLDDLLDVGTAEKLQELTGLNWGTAQRLFKFAKEDKAKMKKVRTK